MALKELVDEINRILFKGKYDHLEGAIHYGVILESDTAKKALTDIIKLEKDSSENIILDFEPIQIDLKKLYPEINDQYESEILNKIKESTNPLLCIYIDYPINTEQIESIQENLLEKSKKEELKLLIANKHKKIEKKDSNKANYYGIFTDFFLKNSKAIDYNE